MKELEYKEYWETRLKQEDFLNKVLNENQKITFELNQKNNEIENIRKSLSFRIAKKISAFAKLVGIQQILYIIRNKKYNIKNINQIGRKEIDELDYTHLLTMTEFEYYQFKEMRDKRYPLIISEVECACIPDLVSIILPVYNGGDLLIQSIDSVLKQTYTNFEFIIVNDGSTDNTPNIIDSYAKKDKRIRIIHKENEKLPKTLSRGFAEARGEYLTWTSADNIMHEDFLEKLVNELNKNPETGMVFANIRLIDENNFPLISNQWYPNELNPEVVMLPHCMLELNTYPNNYIGAAFMYRSSIAHALQEYSTYKYCTEDYDYWMRVNSLFNIRHVTFDEPIYDYRIHPNSLTSKDKELKITENRYRLMALDSFRREFYMLPVVWYIETYDIENFIYQELLEHIKKNNHILATQSNLYLYQSAVYTPIIYVGVGKEIELKNVSYTYIQVNKEEVPTSADTYISLNEISDKDWRANHKATLKFATVSTMFSYLDAKIKNKKLYELERIIEIQKDYKYEVSIIIAYYGNYRECSLILERIRKQLVNLDTFEVIISGSIMYAQELEQLYNNFKQDINIDYIISYEDNIVSCYNTAIWKVNGKITSFIDSRSKISPSYLTTLIYGFNLFENTGCIFGMLKDEIKNINNYNFEIVNDIEKLPTIINCAVLTDDIKIFGGFKKLKTQSNSYYYSGWEKSIYFSLLKLNKCFVHATGMDYLLIDNRELITYEEIQEKVFNEYELEKLQLKDFTSYPNTIRKDIEENTSKYAPNCLKYADAQKVLLKQVIKDFKIKTNPEYIRTKYKMHKSYVKNENKLDYLEKKGLLDLDSTILSVIVPVYRVEEYLERCINSIINQTIKNIEIILVDDGSPDNCPKICDKYAKIDSRIQVIHKKNGGLSDARNVGIDHAKGKYIAFVDSDDWIESNMYEELIFAAEYYNSEIAECSFRYIYSDKSVDEMGKTGGYVLYNNLEALKSEMEWGYFKCVAWNKVYNAVLFQDGKRYPVGKYHEDEFFTHKVFYEAKQLVYVDKILYNYEQSRTDSITGMPFNENNLDVLEALQERMEFFKEKKLFLLLEQLNKLYEWTLNDRLELCKKYNIPIERINIFRSKIK